MKKIPALMITAALVLASSVTTFAGQWRADSTGWWYQEDNGSYPRDAWRFINGSWYYFYSNGYMAHDTWIGGLYYVGSDGRMLSNTITPDGYQVGADGKWIQTSKTMTWRDAVLIAWNSEESVKISNPEELYDKYDIDYTYDDRGDKYFVKFYDLESRRNGGTGTIYWCYVDKVTGETHHRD